MLQTFDHPLAPARARDLEELRHFTSRHGPALGPNLRGMFKALGTYGDHDGDAAPLIQQLADDVEVSLSTAKRSLQQLAGLGLIIIREERIGPDSRRNHYRILGKERSWRPERLECKSSGFQAAAFAVIKRQEAEITMLEQLLDSFGGPDETPALTGQSKRGQIDPAKEEEELSGQFDTDMENSSSVPPSGSGQPDQGKGELGVNLTPNSQPELAVETIEALVDPEAAEIAEMEVWVRAYWFLIGRSPANPGGWKRIQGALKTYREEIQRYRDDRLQYETQWAQEREAEEARQAAAADPPVVEAPEPSEPLPVLQGDEVGHQTWQEVKERLYSTIGAVIAEVQKTEGVEFGIDQKVQRPYIRVACPSQYLVSWVLRRMHDALLKAAAAVVEEETDIIYVVGQVSREPVE